MFDFFTKKLDKSAFSFTNIGADMHCHLIPGIDDGAETMEDALIMLKALEDLGFEKIITTPHIHKDYYPNTKAEILRGLDLLRKEAIKANLSIQIDAAAEYFLDDHFEELLLRDEILPLKGIYVLVEMSIFGASPKLFHYLELIQKKGYIPILAHPERYVFYQDTFDIFHQLKEAGCLFQMNLLSTSGYYDDTVKKMATRLLAHNMIDFLGTDMHHLKHLEAIQNLGYFSRILALIQNYPFKNKLFL